MFKKLIFSMLALLSMSWLLAAVDINTADAQELETLQGIGKAKAAAIVEYRNQNGAFKTKEEIKQVKGIGDKIYAQIENDIEVGAKAPAKPSTKAAVPATDGGKNTAKPKP